jgi:hypothetical protein
MNIEPTRIHKLRFGSNSYKCIARVIHKRTRTVRAWLNITHKGAHHDYRTTD